MTVLEADKRGVRVAFLSYTSIFSPSSAATLQRPGMATIRVDTFFQPHPFHTEVPGLPPTVLTRPVAEDLAVVEEAVASGMGERDLSAVAELLRRP